MERVVCRSVKELAQYLGERYKRKNRCETDGERISSIERSSHKGCNKVLGGERRILTEKCALAKMARPPPCVGLSSRKQL